MLGSFVGCATVEVVNSILPIGSVKWSFQILFFYFTFNFHLLSCVFFGFFTGELNEK